VGSLVREKGIEGLSLREVARRAGVSPGAPAYHFGTRAGMLTAFAVRGYQDLVEAVVAEARRGPAGTPAERLASYGRGYVAFAIAEPGRWEVMFRTELLNAHDPALEAVTAQARALLLEPVRACAQAGLIAEAEVPAVAIAAWSLVHGLAALWRAGRLGAHWGAPEVERLARRVTDLFVAGVLGPF